MLEVVVAEIMSARMDSASALTLLFALLSLASLILFVIVGTKTAARIAMIAITTMSKWIVRRGGDRKSRPDGRLWNSYLNFEVFIAGIIIGDMFG